MLESQFVNVGEEYKLTACSLLGLFFNLEDGNNVFLRNVDMLLPNYVALGGHSLEILCLVLNQ
jgi:hypothetical protein